MGLRVVGRTLERSSNEDLEEVAPGLRIEAAQAAKGPCGAGGGTFRATSRFPLA